MKKRKLRKDDEFGVSPVIAVILMVAITVVLAGVLYAWLMGITDVNPPKTQYEAIVKEKHTYWEIEIVSYSGDPITLEEAKIELISKAKTIKLRTSVSESNPASITSGLSTVYPIPADPTKPVRENATAGDGEIVDTTSVDRPQVWTDCSISFLAADGHHNQRNLCRLFSSR